MKKVYIYGCIFFLTDLLSKVLIMNLNIKMPYKVIDSFFCIDLVSNDGAAFSILSGNTVLFIVIAILVLFYINKYIVTDVKQFLSVSLIIGGIVGNLFDRIIYGSVVDFLSFKFGSYYFPTFNLADSFICVGVLLLLIEFIRGDYVDNKSK